MVAIASVYERPSQVRFQLGKRILFAALLACAIVAPLVQLRQVAHIVPATWSDLYPQWTAARAALHGRDPYSREVTEEIQRGFYGHVIRPDQWDQQNFVYPAHLVLLLAPFTILRWSLVRLLFTIAALPVVAATVWVWMEICGMHLSRNKQLIVLALILTSWPAGWAYQQQQPTIYVAAIIAFSVLLFSRRSDLWAGILLSLATVKPNLVILIAIWLLIHSIAQHRWRFIAAFGLSTATLVAAGQAIVPGWVPRWIETARVYSQDPRKVSLLVHLLGHKVGLAATMLLLIGLCIQLWRFRFLQADESWFGRGAGLLLAATICLIPTTIWMVYNQLLLIPALLILIGERPRSPLAALMRRLAFIAIACVLLVTPLCAVIESRLGYSEFLAVFPFLLDFFFPVAITAALICGGRSPVALKTSEPAVLLADG